MEVSGAARGSAYHRLLELLDYVDWRAERAEREGDHTAYVQNSMNKFVEAGRITQEEINLIDKRKLNVFLNSSVAGRMAEAEAQGNLYKEQPFVLGIEASRLSEEFPDEEKVLIQGIIDVYFIEDGKIVLLDYKTDVVKTGEELKKRYQTQIDYYTEALEKITGLRVKEKILYSFALGEEIAL